MRYRGWLGLRVSTKIRTNIVDLTFKRATRRFAASHIYNFPSGDLCRAWHRFRCRTVAHTRTHKEAPGGRNASTGLELETTHTFTTLGPAFGS